MRGAKPAFKGKSCCKGLVLLAGLALFFVEAAPAADTNSDWSVRVWQTEDGLPNDNVSWCGLAQTRDGYLWVATSGHFARFDGTRFDEFTSRNVMPGYSGPALRVGAMLEDSKGGLWLTMAHGPVVCLNPGRTRIFTNNLPDYNAQSMVEDGESSVWITYHGNAVCRIKGGEVTRFTEKDGLPPRFDCSLAADNQGRLWFAKDGQVGMFRNGHFESLVHSPGNSTRLAGARDGGVWVCSGQELFKCDDSGNLQARGAFRPESSDTDPTAMVEDQNGAVWIGTAAGGLFRYDGSGFESVPTSHPNIASLLVDREGNLWAGTGGGGLNRIQPRTFTIESKATGLPFGSVQSICEDAKGVIWAVTPNGLLVNRTNGNWCVASGEPNWPGGRATCVVADQDGNVWVGMQNQTLLCLRDGAVRVLRAEDGIQSHVVRGLLAATNGDLWIVGEDPDAMQCLRQGRLKNFNVSWGSGVPRALTQDAAGDVWIGTSKGLLLRNHNDVISDETARVSNEIASVRALAATPDGSLWIGYAGRGLGRYKDGQFKRIGLVHGLYNDFISEIVPEIHGWMWFGSDRGIFRIKQKELDAVAEGRAFELQSIHYGKGEGLPSLQANFGVSPNVLHSADDHIWFPMRTVLAVANIRSLSENLDPPPVLLKQVSVDDKIVASYGGIVPVQQVADLGSVQTSLRLPPGHRRVEFDFTALSFSAPENVHLQYRLTDFDQDWVSAGTLRSASYSRLAAGNYQFQIRARNGGGEWSETRRLGLTVTPFFWQTLWFFATVLAAVALVAILIARYVFFLRLQSKLRSLEQQAALNNERSRIAKDIHDDLGGSLTQIKLLFELTQRKRAESDKVEKLGQEGLATTRQIIKSLDEIVWAVNPRNDSLPYLVDYIGQFAIEFLARAGIRCRVDLPDHSIDWAVSPEARHNLFLVVKEALNNVILHAGADEVWLRVTASGNILTITIEDNGHGFEQARTNGFADGILNMQKRMTEIGGVASIQGNAGRGTRVSLTLPQTNGRNGK